MALIHPQGLGINCTLTDTKSGRENERERLSVCFILFNGANKINVFNVYTHTGQIQATRKKKGCVFGIGSYLRIRTHVDPEK